MKYGVAYRLTCSCGFGHFGKIERNLIDRLKEHSHLDKSVVCQHLTDNPVHKVDFDKPDVRNSAGDSARLIVLPSFGKNHYVHFFTFRENFLLVF